MSRGLVYTSAGVLLAAGVACFLAASIEWGDRATMVDPIPTEAAEQAGFVLQMTAIGALNLAAALAILLLRLQIVWWLVVGLQVAAFIAELVQGVHTDPQGWIAFSGVSVGTLIVLVGARFMSAKELVGLGPSTQ